MGPRVLRIKGDNLNQGLGLDPGTMVRVRARSVGEVPKPSPPTLRALALSWQVSWA